jgi:hypothetical protein
VAQTRKITRTYYGKPVRRRKAKPKARAARADGGTDWTKLLMIGAAGLLVFFAFRKTASAAVVQKVYPAEPLFPPGPPIPPVSALRVPVPEAVAMQGRYVVTDGKCFDLIKRAKGFSVRDSYVDEGFCANCKVAPVDDPDCYPTEMPL